MKTYIGTKTIQATPAFKAEDGTIYPNGNLPDHLDSSELEDGYMVVYKDGYTSWSPKEVFEEAYRETNGLTFGQAIEALKRGECVARQGWNGKGMFVFMRPSDELHVSFVAKYIKSLPKKVKDYYYQDCVDGNGNPIELAPDDNVKFSAYLCMKSAQGEIINGWLASQSDMLSDDWYILEQPSA